MASNEMEKFSDLISQALGFYKQDASPFALQVWWKACERFDYDQVVRALTLHAMDAERGQFPPKPADIVRQLDGTATDRAMIAWGKLYDAIQRVGQYNDVVFDDPAIHAAVNDMGGWPKLCLVEMKELSFVQHRFMEIHRAYTNRREFDYPRRLIGERSSDAIFASKGLPPPKPAVVGDIEKAREVYRKGQTTAVAFGVDSFETASKKLLKFAESFGAEA